MGREELLDKRSKKDEFYDIYYASFHGFDKCEKEFRAEGYYYGRASDYAKCKKDLIRAKPRNCVATPISGCYILGALNVLHPLEDVAVILHGPAGCGHNIFCLTNFAKPTNNLVCTEMDENDTIMGGGKKLVASIEEVYERFQPGMIGVVESCTASIIGEDTRGVCETMGKKLQIPVIAFNSSGFKHRVWNMGADEAFNFLIDRMEKSKERKEYSINFINFPNILSNWKEFYELLPYFRELGLKINTHVPHFMTFKELISKFPKGALNVNRCPGIGYQTSEYAEKTLGIPYARLPRPISLKYTEKYIMGIAEFFGKEKGALDLIKKEKDRIRDRFEQVRSKLKGKRIGIAGGGARTLAYAQLAVELGMEVVYIGPYKIDGHYHELLQDWIESSGQNPEVLAEPSIYEGEAIMTRLRPHFFTGIPEERVQVARLGDNVVLDMMYLSYPQVTVFDGAVLFGERLARAWENKFFKRWGHYIWEHFPIYSSEEYLKNSAMATKGC